MIFAKAILFIYLRVAGILIYGHQLPVIAANVAGPTARPV